jgi:hypothetical protein
MREGSPASTGTILRSTTWGEAPPLRHASASRHAGRRTFAFNGVHAPGSPVAVIIMQTARENPSTSTPNDDQRCAECGELFPNADAVAEHQAVAHHAVAGVAEP